MIDVLVIDDNKVDQETVIRLLTKNGMNVTVVSDGKEALEIKQKFQCIVIDYNLSDHDGVELAKKFIQRSNAVIILIKGQLLTIKALKSGVYDYIPKEDLNLLPQAIIDSAKKNELIIKQQRNLKELVKLNNNLDKKLNGGI